uniref:RNA helicase n=1 Tax=Entomoneis paludosa TaxID=265537 RepID=A0A7S2YLW6_9STRA
MGKRDKEHKEKKEKKSRSKREVLEDDPDHERETKRLRTYSKDLTDGDDGAKSKDHDAKNGDNKNGEGPRRRTRSMDKAEEVEVKRNSSDDLTPEQWRAEHHITIQGHGAERSTKEYPAPFKLFKEAPFNSRVQEAFAKAGFEKPTAIQSQAWPIALMNKDMICIAKTGSGKTCGFLLPAFHQHLEKSERKQGYTPPMMLVLAPTRELSVQIMEEAQKFGRQLGIRTVCCYGGASKYPQISALERGVECVIATPGRLNDLLEMRKADLSKIQFLVLDEADRMLDMGFEPQIRSIVAKVPEVRQTLLFSATWPREIQALAHDFLRDPIQINVGEVNALVANKDIKQEIVMCRDDEKFDKLIDILKELTKEAEPADGPTPAGGGKHHAKVIVFVAKKISCHDLANRLWDDGFAVDSLHGDRAQWERTRVMTAFKSGQLRLLIATDVAARGLDVKDVGVVVNYDMPAGVNAVEDYVHRIGRTGRAGAKGKAYTFFTQDDRKAATKLVEVLTKAEQEIPAELQAMVRPRFGGRGGGRGGYGGRGGGRGRGYMGGGGGRGYMGGGGGGRGGRGGYGGGRGGGFGRGRGRF